MKNDNVISFEDIIKNKAYRKEAWRLSTKFFCLYYLSENFKFPELAQYHNDWLWDFDERLNMYIEWHRDSWKTTIIGIGWLVKRIAYWEIQFWCTLCHDKVKAKALNKIIINIFMTNNKLKEDFWVIFDKRANKISEDDLVSEKWVEEFVTTNWIKIKAFGMWNAIRWEIFYTKKKWNVRPDYLLVDDIDNIENTKNKRIIDEDMDFIYQEVFWWLQATAQIIRLWNVIRSDWRNPRIRQYVDSLKWWAKHVNPIYDDNWKITWNRFVETDEEAERLNATIEDKEARFVSLEKKRRDEKSWFTQNWELKPLKEWEKIYKSEWIHTISKDKLPTTFDHIQQGNDPAFSKKTKSDWYGIVITAIKIIDWLKYYYILKAKALYWEDKRDENVVKENKNLYDLYNVTRIKIEWNNGWEIYWDKFKELNMAVDVISTTKDKITKAKEHEWDFMAHRVFFVEWETEELIDQILSFTGEDWNLDDLVDAMNDSFEWDEYYYYTS